MYSWSEGGLYVVLANQGLITGFVFCTNINGLSSYELQFPQPEHFDLPESRGYITKVSNHSLRYPCPWISFYISHKNTSHLCWPPCSAWKHEALCCISLSETANIHHPVEHKKRSIIFHFASPECCQRGCLPPLSHPGARGVCQSGELRSLTEKSLPSRG